MRNIPRLPAAAVAAAAASTDLHMERITAMTVFPPRELPIFLDFDVSIENVHIEMKFTNNFES